VRKERIVNQSTGPHSVDKTIDRIDAAVSRLLASASALSDEQMRAPSLLPGWTRGHVLTHIARSGDGLRNLLIWAETGVETPQYPSAEAREADIEAGAGRPAEELTADVASSAKSFTEHARAMPPEAWTTQVHAIRGPAHPAWFTLNRRLFEVEVHHADLGAEYRPADWPDWFVTEELYRICAELSQDPAAPSAVLNDAASGRQYFLRAAEASDLAITGPGYALLAWLIGREGADELSADPAGPLPEIPSFG
jgi:maleylpyruvate isomerase